MTRFDLFTSKTGGWEEDAPVQPNSPHPDTPWPRNTRRFRMGGYIGRHAHFSNVFKLELHENSAGSPPPAFGFEESDTDRSWPVLDLHIGFCASFEDERDRVATALMECVAKLVKEGIEPQI